MTREDIRQKMWDAWYDYLNARDNRQQVSEEVVNFMARHVHKLILEVLDILDNVDSHREIEALRASLKR